MSEQDEKSIRFFKGVGEKKAALFEKLGIRTCDELLSFYPRDYEDWSSPLSISDAPFGESCCIKARVADGVYEHHTRSGLCMYTCLASDGESHLRIVIFNNRFSAEKLRFGEEYLFYGKVTVGRDFAREMNSPVIESAFDAPKGLLPVYRSTEGLSSRAIRRVMLSALDSAGKTPETLPAGILTEYGLVGREKAIHDIHFPHDRKALDDAKKRLIFEEQLILRIALSGLKSRKKLPTETMIKADYTAEFCEMLPFTLTGAQKRAVGQIHRDMTLGVPMSRLLQGDVGSGKTAVAAAAVYDAIENGFQCAFMAPTEILASQHQKTFSQLFGENISVRLLTGSMTKKEKTAVYEGLESGETQLVIGTHALLEQGVQFKRLGLCITDEQHRFGVMQRSTLTSKGKSPHLLVMSATPIPRTLSLIFYGDLDISVLDEKPPGRKPVATYSVDSSYKKRVTAYIKKYLDAGHQAYIVCPLVEENELSELKSAEKYFYELSVGELKGHRLGLLHGKMKQSEKEKTMNAFLSGEIQLLVATTVIEVGVDVPNACLMIIENAERFGLSQLHQLRGRVGRSDVKSSCILISDSDGDEARARMKIMCRTDDGFKIAEEDLKMRGPGDFFGSRQHGLPGIVMSAALTDTALLGLSSRAAESILSFDPSLSLVENSGIKSGAERLLQLCAGGILN